MSGQLGVCQLNITLRQSIHGCCAAQSIHGCCAAQKIQLKVTSCFECKEIGISTGPCFLEGLFGPQILKPSLDGAAWCCMVLHDMSGWS